MIDKPAGLVVHPAPGHWDDTLVNALVARGTTLSGGAEGRPGIVHRLDRDTSGLMVVAKTDLAHRRLGAAIAARRVSATYAALAWGHLDASPTVIEAPIARHPQDRKRMTIIARWPGGPDRRLRGRPLRRGRPAPAGASHRAHPPDPGPPRAHRAPDRRRPGLRRGREPADLRAPPGGPPRRWSGRPPGRRCMRRLWHSATPPRARPLEFRSEWPADLRPALLALGGEDLVARPDPLGYLLFFNRDG